MTNANKNKVIAGIVTAVVHAIIVVLLFVLCFRTPLPLPGEAGVEVDMGMFAEVNEVASQQVNEATSQQVNEATSQHDEEDILSEDEDIPMIEEVKEVKDEKEVEEVKEVEEIEEVEEVEEEVLPVVNKRALFQVSPNNSDATITENNTNAEGDLGNPNGLKDIDRYDGHGGSGGGPAYDLGGRGAKSIPSPSRDFAEEGKVVVDIWVDKKGRVTRAEIGKGTTVTDSNMRESARQAAMSSLFVEDKDASDIQKGTITYTFIIRQ